MTVVKNQSQTRVKAGNGTEPKGYFHLGSRESHPIRGRWAVVLGALAVIFLLSHTVIWLERIATGIKANLMGRCGVGRLGAWRREAY